VGERGFGVRDVRIRGFRSARSVGFSPGPVCGLVGGPRVGKSNVLAAVWTLLRQEEPGPRDATRGLAGPIRINATLAGGDEVRVEAAAPGRPAAHGPRVPVLFLPASERADGLVAQPVEHPAAQRLVAEYLAPSADGSSASRAAGLVAAVERLCEADESGLVLLVEEPELFLRPHAQRSLYRLLRAFAEHGNQVLYSTHSPWFLNVGRLDELALVEWGVAGTHVTQPSPLPADESFRALSEVDAERSELFLASAVLLVEGRTEKLTFPFVFRALGYDADREGISIVECGGKPNMPLFVRICETAQVPYLAVHDRDAAPGRKPIHAERMLNAQIAELAGQEQTVVLAPDFEGVAGLKGRGQKPARAFKLFSGLERDDVPDQLRDAVERVLALARRDGGVRVGAAREDDPGG
jgi:predicted ATP-dependent endonuclease of OLD family